MRSRLALRVLLVALVAATAKAQTPDTVNLTSAVGKATATRASPAAMPLVKTPAPTARRFCLQGRPRARCRGFALLELTTHSHWFGSKIDDVVTRPGTGGSRWDDALASHITGDIGAMVNVGARTAIGGTITGGSVRTGGRPLRVLGATVRYRRWLTPAISADAGAGLMRMQVGTVVPSYGGPRRENVPRPALVADVRLGFHDLLSATGRFMVASDGEGHTHTAFFVGAATGSQVTAVITATVTAVLVVVAFVGPRGDKVTVQ